MATEGPSAADLVVLRALAWVREDDVAPTLHAIAGRAGSTVVPVMEAVNRLWQAGLVTESLEPTEAGEQVLASAPTP